MNLQEQIYRIQEMMGTGNARHKFDFSKLVLDGIVWVTQPFKDGKPDEPNWEYDSNIVTLHNLENPEEGQEWVYDAIDYPKSESIDYWTQEGQFTMLGDEKYNQIIKSINDKGHEIDYYTI
jgi:hypothetical protein